MITLPDLSKAFEYENNFYLSCDNSRIAKLIAQYELFRMAADVDGSIVECGVFKGVSLVRFAHFRAIAGLQDTKAIYGFDTFSDFPSSDYEPDNELLAKFIDSAGSRSISKDQLHTVLEAKGISDNVSLIDGDVNETVPEFIEKNPGFQISFLNLDVDLYGPSKVILENFFPLISPGGILLLDDYGKFPGETKAADDYFRNASVEIKQFQFARSPSYIIKPR
jgi:hypothetical protein